MHQTRQQATTRLPITRKGTKYVARASSDLENSVPVVIAMRDILKLAKTKREVRC
jgi:ribosomal protein S4E